MIKTLQESKAKLSELIRRANQGEDILITVRGEVKAKLIGVESQNQANTMKTWALELQDLQKAYTRQAKLGVEGILAESRQERL